MGPIMSANLSVSDVVETLRERMAWHREQEALHAEREEHHRQERARHAAELETIQKHLESFQQGAALAAGAPARPLALGPGERPKLTRLVVLAVSALEPDRPFSAGELAGEIDRRFGDRLKKPAERRLVSIALRRMLDRKQLRLVRKGKPHVEALYARAVG